MGSSAKIEEIREEEEEEEEREAGEVAVRPAADEDDLPGPLRSKLGVKAPPMPTATRLSFHKTCAKPGCPRADPREARMAGCGIVACSHCNACFWCSQECASEDWKRHRTCGECRPPPDAPPAGDEAGPRGADDAGEGEAALSQPAASA